MIQNCSCYAGTNKNPNARCNCAYTNEPGNISNISLLLEGDDAYEVALKRGYQGTADQWLEWLREPATQAALQVQQAINDATDAVNKAEQAVLIATQAAATSTGNNNQIITLITDVNAALTAAQSATNNLNSKIGELNTVISEANTDINDALALAVEVIDDVNDSIATIEAARVLANTATTNANTAISNINSKITDINTAISNANTAATTASNAKGWTPVSVYEGDGLRVVLKLSDYIGGTGVKPTANLNQYYKSDGTFTSNKAEAFDYSGKPLMDLNTTTGVGQIRVYTGSVMPATPDPNVIYLIRRV